MTERTLNQRQMRELKFYNEFSSRRSVSHVDFSPVEGNERRPWNSYWRFMELVKAHYTSQGQSLLDFGCGTGEYSVLFSRIGYDVYGFDIAPNNIAVAQRLAESYGLQDRAHFSVGVAETLDYEDESFDVVTGINILHHVDIKSSIAGCMRLLKPGGIAMFHEPVRAPVFDAVRESRLGTNLVPKGASFERHVTEDERKLSDEDLEMIRGFGYECSFERFALFSRLDRFIKRDQSMPSSLEQLDARIFRVLPFARRFAGECIITLRK